MEKYALMVIFLKHNNKNNNNFNPFIQILELRWQKTIIKKKMMTLMKWKLIFRILFKYVDSNLKRNFIETSILNNETSIEVSISYDRRLLYPAAVLCKGLW